MVHQRKSLDIWGRRASPFLTDLTPSLGELSSFCRLENTRKTWATTHGLHIGYQCDSQHILYPDILLIYVLHWFALICQSPTTGVVNAMCHGRPPSFRRRDVARFFRPGAYPLREELLTSCGFPKDTDLTGLHCQQGAKEMRQKMKFIGTMMTRWEANWNLGINLDQRINLERNHRIDLPIQSIQIPATYCIYCTAYTAWTFRKNLDPLPSWSFPLFGLRCLTLLGFHCFALQHFFWM